MIDREAVTKSHKGKKVHVERKVGVCCHWKATDNVRRRLISHGQIVTGTSGEDQRRKGQSSCPAPNSKAKPDGKGKRAKTSGNRDEDSSDKKEQDSMTMEKLYQSVM